MLIDQIKSLSEKLHRDGFRADYIINCVKEYLQIIVLEFIYNNKNFNKKLIFTGGTCLRLCFELPRLSEDLDFDCYEDIDIKILQDEINQYFSGSLRFSDISSSVKGKEKKIYLKFPILKSLNLSYKNSNMLYLKIETEKFDNLPYKSEVSTINRNGRFFYLNRYSMPDLMSGKVNAFLTRPFFKGKENEIDFKGRDVFDLIWFMSQDIKPNIERLQMLLRNTEFSDLSWLELLHRIGVKLSKMKIEHLRMDLINFLDNPKLFDGFIENFRLVFEQYHKKQEKDL